MGRYNTVEGYLVTVESYGNTQEIIIMGNNEEVARQEAKAEFIRQYGGNNPRICRLVNLRELPTLETSAWKDEKP